MNALVNSILTQPWFISEAALDGYIPFLTALVEGKTVKFDTENNVNESYTIGFNTHTLQVGRWTNLERAIPGSIAIHPVNGVITKFDQSCGPRGTVSLLQAMMKADRHENIKAHILEVDSGGGQATNIQTIARGIRNNISKPVIGIFNGMAASAGLYLIAACDEVYAAQNTDITGSLGALAAWADIKPVLEKAGVKFHKVFATQSTKKQKMFLDAEKGNYNQLRAQILDPMVEEFIADVKAFRPNITNAEVFTGETYTAVQAVELGIIDGVKTMEEVIARASELAENSKNNSAADANNQSINMKNNYPKLHAILGDMEIGTEGDAKGVFLNLDQLAEVNTALTTPAPAATASEETTTPDVSETIASLQKLVQTQTESITNLQTEIANLKGKPAAAPATATADADLGGGEEDDALASYNKAIAASAEKGGTVNFKSSQEIN